MRKSPCIGALQSLLSERQDIAEVSSPLRPSRRAQSYFSAVRVLFLVGNGYLPGGRQHRRVAQSCILTWSVLAGAPSSEGASSGIMGDSQAGLHDEILTSRAPGVVDAIDGGQFWRPASAPLPATTPRPSSAPVQAVRSSSLLLDHSATLAENVTYVSGWP